MAAAESIKAFECRVFEKLLKSKFKNANYRRKVIRNTLTELVEKERVETSLARAKDVARVANRMIDLAKENNEPIVYTWLMNKSLVPKVFNTLVPRYATVTEKYTRVYNIPPTTEKFSSMGIVEFIGNSLPPLEPTEEELVKLKAEILKKQFKSQISPDGILV